MKTRYFYAVQSGDNFDWDLGSYNYHEAEKIAKRWIKDGEKNVRIAFIDEKFNEISNRLEKFIANGEIEESNSSMSLNFN